MEKIRISVIGLNFDRKHVRTLANMEGADAITPDVRVLMPAARVAKVIDALDAVLRREAVRNHLDSLRIQYPDEWGLMRPSITGPVIILASRG